MMGAGRLIRIESRVPGCSVEVVGMDIHVYPRTDLLAHELTDDCACLPVTEPIVDKDGDLTVNWLVSHNAWDGRP